MDLHVSLNDPRRLAAQIYSQVRDAITAGELRPGDAMPSSRELSRSLNVSRNTVIAAYDRLTAEGLLRSRPGAGVYVAGGGRDAGHRRDATPPIGQPQPRPLWTCMDRLDEFLSPAGEFDFRCGVPSLQHFPFAVWRPLVSRHLRLNAPRAGSGAEPAGSPRLRRAVARHISVSRGVRAEPDSVFITSGTQQAIDLIARVLLAPGDEVAVEDPAYLPPTMLFRSQQLTVTGVPVDAGGIVVDAIPPSARLIYVTPSHQYPLGMSMSLERRHELLRFAERTGAVIIEDDYDSDFRYTGRPLDSLQSLDRSWRVIYTGSFSKTTQPGMRLGFMVPPPSIFDALRRAKLVTDWHTPRPQQEALADFIDTGEFGRHVRRMRRIYQQRHELIGGILQERFSDVLTVIPGMVGIHLSALFIPGLPFTDDNAVRLAAARGVRMTQPTSHCSVTLEPRSGLMLGYGSVPTARIAEGLALLRRCIDELSFAASTADRPMDSRPAAGR